MLKSYSTILIILTDCGNKEIIMTKTYIIDAIRTPMANFGGALKEVSAVKLGALLIEKIISKNKLQESGLTGKIDGVVIGNVLSSGLGQNPARQCALKGGLPETVPAFTLNKACGSSLKAIDIAYRDIMGCFGSLYLAGGIESMSSAPYLLKDARWGYKLGDKKVVDGLIVDGLFCPFNNTHMGNLIDSLASELNISRARQDEFSLTSHKKAIKAIAGGRFADEIIPVEAASRKGSSTTFSTDEHPRPDTTLEALAGLKPAFTSSGTVTAGNSSGINDGAALILAASEKIVSDYNLEPLAEIITTSEASIEPKYFGLAPVGAIKKVLATAGLNIADIELFELNEAFAAQSIAVIDKLGIDPEIVNVNGGAIALGHPIGASGARIVVTLVHEMVKRDLTYGLAALCIGSGEGMAIILKRGN